MSTAYLVQWDKTQNTWHVDIRPIGRYSVQRRGAAHWRAFLNNVLIEDIDGNADVKLVKAVVEERIIAARIAGELKVITENDKRSELISAARGGIGLFLNSTRGAHMFGSRHHIIQTDKGFCLVYGDDNRVYFDVTEM